jgi:2-polyprenyl-3-methyl-5-hydroxy-6-metoxy-1,4-benzoquinol methylase
LDHSTIDYYNEFAKKFYDQTVGVDFSANQDKFLNKLPAGAWILDFGCGSGRDTKYFLEKGYKVDATDGSDSLCKLASQYTGITVSTYSSRNYKKLKNMMASGRVPRFYIWRKRS